MGLPMGRSDRKVGMKRSGSLAVLAFVLGVASASAAEVHEKGRTWSGIILKSPDLKTPFVLTTFSYVHARWTQPTVFCTQPNAEVSIWVGIDGNGTPTVEQAGTIAVCGEAAAPLSYYAFWEMYEGPNSLGGQPFMVSPGDIIDASVTYSEGVFEMVLTDITSGRNLSVKRRCGIDVECKRGTAEWIVERPGSGKYPLANYGRVQFADLRFTSSSEDFLLADSEMVQSGTTLSTCQLVVPPTLLPAQGHDTIDCTWVAATSP